MPKTKSFFTFLLAVLAVLALSIAACGGGSDSPQTVDPPPTTQPTTTTTVPDELEPEDLNLGSLPDELQEPEQEIPTPSNGEPIGPGIEDTPKPPSLDGPAPTLPAPTLDEGLTDAIENLVEGEEREQPDIRVVVVDGELQEGERRYDVSLGERLIIEVVTDKFDQEIHLHGYDLTEFAGPLAPARFDFVADLPGVWEVEFEATHELIFELAVS